MSWNRRLVALLDSLFSQLMLCLAALVFAFGCYALWDSREVGRRASSSYYQTYKPTSIQQEDNLDSFSAFERLRQLNKDVLGWLNLYGTQIDYPLLQASDNDTYLNKDAKGEFSVTGALFLDYRSSPYFDDFNTIIHGHHVEDGVMFGDLDKFREQAFFEAHRYGSIYYNGAEKGLDIIAAIDVDAYDTTVYQPGIYGADNRLTYYHHLLSKSLHKRDVTLSANDQLILMSTCFLEKANGRTLLLAKVSDTVVSNPFAKSDDDVFPYYLFGKSTLGQLLRSIPLVIWYLIIVGLLMMIILLLFVLGRYLKRAKRQQKP
ncbi:class B sortase [Streptococcus sp. zg-JUN1979]|uniref:class B sortase n=1 Tax=Streptococcus sp. zg-JUN1979 TaxID=3391450 RepID=UPI0039A4B4AB